MPLKRVHTNRAAINNRPIPVSHLGNATPWLFCEGVTLYNMYLHLKLILASILVCLLTACAGGAVGPRFSEVKTADSSASALYVYRLPNFVGGGNAPLLFIDGIEVTSLKNAGHVRRELSPGRHVIELRNGSVFSKMKPLAVHVTAEAGGTYFIRYAIELRGSEHVFGTTTFIHNFGYSFNLIERDIALAEMKETSEVR